MAASRTVRKLLLIAVTLVVLLVVLVAAAPALISMGLGRGAITRAVAQRVNGTVVIDDLSLGWRGPQIVRGLRITDATKREAVKVDVEVRAGLLGLAFGGLEILEADVGGALSGILHEDGTTSFSTLAVDSGDAAPGAPASPPSLAGVPPLLVTFRDVRIDLDTTRPEIAGIALDRLSGTVRYQPGGDTVVDLQSPTTAGKLTGSIDLDATIKRLVDADGAVTASGADVHARLIVRSLPVPFDDQVDEIRLLDVTLDTRDLAQRIGLELLMETLVAGKTSTLRGDLALAAPVRADGTPDVSLDRLTGTLAGAGVPSAAIQPLFAGTPIVLARDVGPIFDVDARFDDAVAAGGEESFRKVHVKLVGSALTLGIGASVSDRGAVIGDVLTASAQVHPGLVAALAGSSIRLEGDRPAPMTLTLDSFQIPARLPDRPFLLDAIAVDGRLAVASTLEVHVGADAPMPVVPIRNLDVRMATPFLREGLTVTGTAEVAGGRLALDERVTGLIDAEGALAPAAARPVGTMTLDGADGVVLAALVTALVGADAATPLTAAIADQLRGGPFAVEIVTTVADGTGALDARLTASANGVQVAGHAEERDEVVHVDSAAVTLDVAPALVAAAQDGGEDAVRLEAPARATLELDPFDLPRGADGIPKAPTAGLVARLGLGGARVAHTALVEAVLVDRLDARVAVGPGPARTTTITGTGTIKRGSTASPLGALAFDVSAAQGDDGLTPTGTVTVSAVEVAALEAVLGHEPGKLAGLLGDRGAVVVELAGDAKRRTATVSPEFPRLSGELRAALDGEVLSAEGGTLTLTLAPALVERLLASSDEKGGAPAPALRVAADLPMNVTLRMLRVPLALGRGEPFDPSMVELDASLSGGPLRLADATGVLTSLERLTVVVTADGLAKGVSFTVKGQASVRDAVTPGVIDLTGTATRLVAADSTLDLSGAALDLDGTVKSLPTSLADRLLGLDSLLVAAVGLEMESTFDAKSFSRNGGVLKGSLTAQHGKLGGTLQGGENALHTTSEDPVKGTLTVTPELGAKLLSRIHPVLADIRSSKEPIRFEVTAPSRIPVDGDVSRLDADLRIEVGDVQFTTGSFMLGILGAFDDSPKQTLPGRIDPILVSIRSGVVTYQQFKITVDGIELPYEGQMNLVTKQLDIRTVVPIRSLAIKFDELRGVGNVPVRFHGPFQNPKTEFDFAGLAGSTVETLIEKGIGDLIKDDEGGGGIGTIIGDIFGGGKKKKKDGE